MNVKTSRAETQFFNLTNSHFYSEKNYLDSSDVETFHQTEWDAVPAAAKPVPLSLPEDYWHNTMFDPNLSITPEKTRLPTLMKLSSVGGGDDEDCADFRETKVHFDQNVAVHHISPEVSTDLSMGNSSIESDGSLSIEAVSTACECDEALSRDLVNSKWNLDEFIQSYSLAGGDAYVDQYCGSNVPLVTKDLNSLKIQDPDLDLSIINATDCCEPISVVASDLYSKTSFGKPRRGPFYSNKKSHSMSSITNYQSVPTKEVFSRKDSPIVGDETTMGSVKNLIVNRTAGTLSQPELNSTLRLSKEMASLRAKELDVQAVLNDPKIKGRIEEKACAKLNANSAMYTNLSSLDVQEEELFNRIAESQLAKVRPESGTRVKPENLVSKPPDIMEFFTPDLQPEFASYTLFGIAPDQIETRTVDLDRAFDIYKHTRVWERYDINL